MSTLSPTFQRTAAAAHPPAPPPADTGAATAPRDAAPRTLDAAALLGADRTVLIRLDGEHYRLSLTRAGKLILTK